MALNNYGRALGQLATESVKGSVKGFAMGIKGAAMNEMPGLTALMGLSREVKSRADKLGEASAIDASVKEQKTNNIISIEMVRQLRSINNNVLQQTRISALQANNAKQTAMFAEEADREKSQRDKELLDAIKSLKGGAGAGRALGADGAGAGGGNGFLGTLFGALQNAKLLEAVGVLAGGKYIFDKGKTIFGKGAGKVPTPTTGGTPPTGSGSPPSGGGGKVIQFPPGGRGGIPTPPIGGGGFGGGGGLLRGAGIAARGILRVLLGPIGWALLAAEVGYEAYKIFGAQGGQSGRKLNSGAGQLDYGDLMTAMNGGTLGDNALGGGVSQAAQKVVRSQYSLGPAQGRVLSADQGKGSFGADASEFIMGKEGFRTKAYPDAGKFAVGHGHSITAAEIKSGQIDLGNGEFIKVSGEKGATTTVTREQADKLFSKDLAKYESIVIQAIGQEAYNKLSQNQKTAILSYAYNTGSVPNGFAKAIKDGNFAMAAASIRNGVATASGENDPVKRKGIEAALKVRRKKEGDLFDTAGPATSEQRKNSSGVLTNTSAPSPASIAPIPLNAFSGTTLTKAVGKTQVQDTELAKIATKQLAAVNKVATQGANAKSADAKAVPTKRAEENKDKKYLRDANQTFLNQFQSTTQRLLSETLYKAIVVGAYGKEGSRNLVSKQEASAEGYRGANLSNLLKLPAKTEKILTSAFGKKLGQAYAPMVSQLSTAYLEVGARKVGRGLFAGMGLSDNDSDALTGQILGNFAKGNKQAATEQLLYGMTGVASGPETIFAKYGFSSSQQGTNFLGGMGAANLTAPLAGMMDGKQPTFTGPYGQGTYGAGQYPRITSQQGGAGSNYTLPSAVNNRTLNDQSLTTVQRVGVAESLMSKGVGTDEIAKQLGGINKNTLDGLKVSKEATETAQKNFIEAQEKARQEVAGTVEWQTAQQAATISKQVLDNTMSEQDIKRNDLLQSVASNTAASAKAGGGSNFMGNMGNFAFDLATSMVANKLTKNIKNPYLKAFANYGITTASNSFIKNAVFGAPTAAGAAPGFFSAGGGASQLGSSLFSSSGPGFAGTAGNMLTTAGYTTAGSFMSGVQAGMNTLGTGAPSLALNSASTGATYAGEVIGEALPYAQAIVFALKGDYKKAITSAVGSYVGAAIGTYFGGPLGAKIGAAIGGYLGGLIGRKPKPALLRITSTSGNEVSAVTAWEKDKPPEAFSKFADMILGALLNSAKLMQQKSGVALPFVNIGIYVDSVSGVSLCLYQEGEATNTSALPKWNKNFGAIKDFKMGTSIVGMIEYMRDCLKEGRDAITTDKLDQATKELKSKNIHTLTSGVLTELKAGGQYDLTKGVGYSAGKPATDGVTIGKATGRDLSNLGGKPPVAAAITPSGTTTPASNLTASTQTTTLNNATPVNSVVAVGGKTENDNSTTINNINSPNLMNDPWRQTEFNTGYQLYA